jgi:hypothetical protein
VPHGHENLHWQPPSDHEHGDAPPAWVLAAGYSPSFTHAANTPNENHLPYKHTGFKGYSARLNGVDVYVIMHLDTNPSGHTSRFHSYQFWMRDPSGGVSHMHGWLDFGGDDLTQTGPNLRRIRCDDTGVRPIIAVNDQSCGGPIQFESWYSRAAGHRGQAGWMPDFGFNTSANYYTGGDPTDPATWVGTGGLNLVRRFEVAWYADRSNLRGTFWSDQFGRLMSGPNDSRCGTTYTVGTRSYTVLCLEQFIAPTAVTLSFPGNALQKTYPGPEVRLPN